MDVVILGAGVAGLGAAYRLREHSVNATVYESADHWGGLCASYSVNGFRFDTFGHISFDIHTRPWLEEKTGYNTYAPYALNYDAGHWLRHPLQEHLCDLPIDERIEIIESFVKREEGADRAEDYGQWLCRTYGRAFAEKYPYRYTRKYWTVEPDKLGTAWAQGRLGTLSLEQLLRGAMDDSLPSTHYSKAANYPLRGGFQSFVEPLTFGTAIRCGKRASGIDPNEKRVIFSDGSEVSYEKLISTIPLPELCGIVQSVPEEIRHAASRLVCTSGITVSIGLSRPDVAPAAWFYVYDDALLPSRINAPSFFSSDNAPLGFGCIQAEIYYSPFAPRRLPLSEVCMRCVDDMIKMGLFSEEEIVVADVREHPYANVIFTKDIYSSRKVVLDYMAEQGILCAGRFGSWDYLWVGQSLLSGFDAAEKVLRRMEIL